MAGAGRMPLRMPSPQALKLAGGGDVERMLGEQMRRRHGLWDQGVQAEMPPLDGLGNLMQDLSPEEMQALLSMDPQERQRLLLEAERSLTHEQSQSKNFWKPQQVGGGSRQRAAMEKLYNSGPLGKMRENESSSMWQDMGASMLDPTQLPLLGSGALSKLAPSIFRAMPMKMPLKARAGEFGMWGTSGSNLKDASPDPEGNDTARQFGYEGSDAARELGQWRRSMLGRLPAGQRMIGQE